MRTVADAMVAPPVIVEPATTIQDAAAAMLEGGVHAAVVVDDGRVCGITTAENISRALAAGYDATETLVGAIADRDRSLARPEEPLAEVHQRMRAEGHGVVPVAGAHGEPVGMLADPEAGG
jgi:CBS domain-containing protein